MTREEFSRYVEKDYDRLYRFLKARLGNAQDAQDLLQKTLMKLLPRLEDIDAKAPDGTAVNLILQDDWHVRVLGPGGVVFNSTELKPGDKVLGYLPQADRHVGYPINEFCLEK